MLKPARDAALRDGKVMNVEYRVQRPRRRGRVDAGDRRGRRNDNGEPVWFGGMVQDITSRKKDEQALLESERELQSVHADAAARRGSGSDHHRAPFA